MHCEPAPAPETPTFHNVLEARLRSAAAGGSGRRLPVPTTALRALRHASGYAFHTALAVCLAAAVLLIEPGGGHPVPVPDGAAPEAGIAYVRQVGGETATPAETARMAREHGYEVGMVRIFVPDRSSDGKVLSITHAGAASGVPDLEVARGPVLILVGVAVGAGGTIAT